MYNLFVSADDEDWNGAPFVLDLSRCLREYTDDNLFKRFGALTGDSIEVLKQLPSIFACESGVGPEPKFGVIRSIARRQAKAVIEYDLIEVNPFITADDLDSKLAFQLDIGSWEMNRTHWALKDVDLGKELAAKNIILPRWVRSLGSRMIDVTKHTFDVALSFPGEERTYVGEIAKALEHELGPHKYFYDQNYVGQLARPSLDSLLQDIYGNRSVLIVVFVGSNYQKKNWCGIEFRAIREIINRREHDRVMLIRMDDGEVEGIHASDGYIDARVHSARDVASFIGERVRLLTQKSAAE